MGISFFHFCKISYSSYSNHVIFIVLSVGIKEMQEIKKKRTEKGGAASNVHPSTTPASKPSTDQIRQSVRQSLKEILEKRYGHAK